MVLRDGFDADVQTAVFVAPVVQLAQEDSGIVVGVLRAFEGGRLLLQQIVVSVAVRVDVLGVGGVGGVEDHVVFRHRERRRNVLEDAPVGVVGRRVAVEADFVHLDQVLRTDVARVEELVGVRVCRHIPREREPRLLLCDCNISQRTHHHDEECLWQEVLVLFLRLPEQDVSDWTRREEGGREEEHENQQTGPHTKTRPPDGPHRL